MQQHALPQNVTTYQFRLVGDMTLKQFLELASGVVLAYFIISSKLNFLIKWTLGPFLAIFGFALAFVPFEDRPLDRWIISFFKAVYSPTQYLWRLSPKTLDIFAPVKVRPPAPKTKSPTPAKLEEYIKTLPHEATVFEQAEQNYLTHIISLFGALGAKVPPLKPVTLQPKNPADVSVKGIRIRKLLSPQMCLLPHAVIFPQIPTQAAMPEITPTPPVSAPAPVSTPVIISPKPPPIKAKAKTKPVILKKPSPPSTPAVFAQDALIPLAPEKPNIISGITLDHHGKILPNVILEIKDSQGHPARAVKSNKLGQFFTATPLPDGVYQVEAEHSDFRFAIMKLEAKSEIIPPLKIQAVAKS